MRHILRARAGARGLAVALLASGTAVSGAVGLAAPVPEGWCGTGTGGLHVVTGGEILQREFPLKHTKVDAEVSGPVARVEVTQVFQNPYVETIEAVYVFPLPHEAAVTDLEMRLGERVIRGLIERRDEARRTYEEARDRGRVAALLEQERPNIFMQSVANILPGNEIEIKLTYVETLDYDAGEYEFVFPMVVGPRFLPPASTSPVVPAGGFVPPDGFRGLNGFVPPGDFVPAPAPGPDAHRLDPPFLPPEIRSGHDIEIRVSLDAGVPLRDLRSETHAVQVTARGADRATVSLSPLDTIPNRDFVLAWDVTGEAPEIGVLAHHDGEEGYVTVLLHPKRNPGSGEITPKEMIFVMDSSGSMRGAPIAAAKAMARHAIRNLGPGDTFQIIRFSMSAAGFARAPVLATSANVKSGIAYVDRLAVGGGTMMIEGVKAALDFPEDPERLRIVMFLTDGYIGNESTILAAVREKVGSARLFSFGVGSSVNRFLLDRMAEEGRGAVQYFLPGSDVRAEVARFYDRIRNPYLTDLDLAWEGVAVEDVYPARVPDLFAGRPLVILARYGEAARGNLTVRGRIAGRRWERRVRLDLPGPESGNPAVGSLWARARISDLERAMLRGGSSERVEEITRLALKHRLVTRYTSFVAVEEGMVVSGGSPRTVHVPVEMPEGVSWEGVFGPHTSCSVETKAAVPPGGPPRPGTSVLGFLRANPDAYSRRGRGGEAGTPIGSPSPGAALGELRDLGYIEASPPERPARREEDGAAPSGEDFAWTALRVTIAADRAEVRLGEKVTVTVTVTNGSRAAVPIPVDLPARDGLPELRIIDARWHVRTSGSDTPAPRKTRALAPGASATYTFVLDPHDGRLFAGPGIYHLILVGGPFGAEDSDRITIRIVG